MSNSTSRKFASKPKKPYPAFPLTPHASGKWQKKINGSTYYFGRWAKRMDGRLVRVEGDGWREALELYKAQADDLHAGRAPRVPGDKLTVVELADKFLCAKHQAWQSREISERMFTEYKLTCDWLVAKLGRNRTVSSLRPEDFARLRAELSNRYGVQRIGSEVQKTRTLFKYAFDAELIDKTVRFGPIFKKPSKRIMRKARQERGINMFTAGELRRMIETADQPLRSMLFLGINGGLGNGDCGLLPMDALDLDGGWLKYPRPKTAVNRRIPLWPETVASIREWLAVRPEPKAKEHGGLVFITKYGLPWHKRTSDNPVSKETRKLLDRLGIRGRRNFYSIRHTHRTIADGAKDPAAADSLMGHEAPHMSSIYREVIDDDRLHTVTEHVRRWLFELDKPADGPPVTLKLYSA
jgi:integrase